MADTRRDAAKRPVLLPAVLVAWAVCVALESTFQAFTPGPASTAGPAESKALRTSDPSGTAFAGGSKAPIAIGALLAAAAFGGIFLRGSDKTESLWESVKLPIFVALWYVFNIQYNIQNKKLLQVFDASWAVSWCQLASGIPVAMLMWATGMLVPPKVTANDVKILAPSGLFFALGQVATVASLGAGAVSFTHVVKALEPAVNAVASAFLLGQVFHPVVYCSLLPVFAGVGLASASEMSFTMYAFMTAMSSNVFFALRNVVATKNGSVGDMGEGVITRKTNQLCVLTVVATAVLLPVVAFIPGGLASFGSAWSAALEKTSASNLTYMFCASGFHFFMYQMSSFWVLSQVQPITHSVLNTLKRVVIIIASIIVFRNPVTFQGAMGTGIAIGGVLLYVLTKAKYK